MRAVGLYAVEVRFAPSCAVYAAQFSPGGLCMLDWGPTPRNLKEAPPLESVFGSEDPNEAASPSGKEVYPSPLCSEAVQEMNDTRT